MKHYIASDLKDMNRRTVYNLLSTAGEISRAEISRRTGISSPTVIKIIDHFLDIGIACMGGEGESKLGRKPQIIKFNYDAAYSLGIEFDEDHMYIGLVNLSGEILDVKQYKNEPFIHAMFQKRIPESVSRFIAEKQLDKEKILGVGIGIPGSVNSVTSIIEFASIFGINTQIDLSNYIEELEKILGFPVIIERDVYAAARGEFLHASPDNSKKDLIFLLMGSGVGAGIILDGRLRRGSAHLAGEIGYLCFDPKGRINPSSLGWLEEKVMQARRKFKDGTREVINEVADNLALAVSALSISLDIDHVVFGGIQQEPFGACLLDAINQRLPGLCLRSTRVYTPRCKSPTIAGLALIITERSVEKVLGNFR